MNYMVRIKGKRKFIPIFANKRKEAKIKLIRLEKSKEMININKNLKEINVPVKNVCKAKIIFKGGLK